MINEVSIKPLSLLEKLFTPILILGCGILLSLFIGAMFKGELVGTYIIACFSVLVFKILIDRKDELGFLFKGYFILCALAGLIPLLLNSILK